MPTPHIKTIKAVGFDLDQTLYPNSPEVQRLVRGEIYNFISTTLNIGLETARERFDEAYDRIGGGGRALESLGIANGSERLRDCVAKADISRILKPDQQLERMISRISNDYFTFLITESRREDAIKKLHALSLCPSMFKYTAYWDTTQSRKHTGTIYPLLFQLTAVPPAEHLYVGDKMNDDILPAKKAGLMTVLVGSENPAAHHCIKEIYNLEGLLYGR